MGNKPQNILNDELKIIEKIKEQEKILPSCLNYYYDYMEDAMSILTIRNYLDDLINFFEYLTDAGGKFEDKKIKEITMEDLKLIKAEDINAFLKYVKAYERNGVYYNNNNHTRARKRAALINLFSYLYKHKLIDEEITTFINVIKLPKIENQEIKVLTDEQIKVTLEAVTTGAGFEGREKKHWEYYKYRDKAILLLFLTCGLRKTELYQLNLDSFTKKDYSEIIIYRKRDKEVAMPINEITRNAIKDYLELERKNDVNSNALFLSSRGNRLSTRQVVNVVKKYTSVAMNTERDKGYSPHKLRATAATSLIQRGASIYDVKDLLDHEDVTTTQRYAKHKKETKKEMVSELNDLL